MTRLFARGQLKVALLQVAAELGPANGYAIMQALDERIGGSWRPSPGAIYPALLALEDAGLLAGRELGGVRTYELTAAGRGALDGQPDAVGAAAARARSTRATTTVGQVLDRVAAAAPHRSRRLDAADADALERRLARAVRVALDDAHDPTDAVAVGPTHEEHP